MQVFRTKTPVAAMALTAFLCLMGLTGNSARAGQEEGGDDTEINNGQDITQPVTRIDIRYQYENTYSSGTSKDDTHIVTLRADRPFTINDKWKIGTRIDLPLVVSDRVANDNTKGAYRFGVGDFLAQALIINVPSEKFAWALGAQIVVPTATRKTTGTGRFQVVPTFGARWTTNNILRGSWFALAARWAKDFASVRNDSTPTNELQFAPIVNIPLPNAWFINLFPSTDIRYNLGKKRPGDTGRWFIPANAMVGKMLRKNVVASLEVGVPIVKQYKVYDFKTEFRIGIFF